MNMTNNNNDDDEMETESLAIVKRMFEQYPNNPNMKQKIHHYIKNLLPGICENACQQQKEREERKNSLEEKSDEFIEEFLAKRVFFITRQLICFLHIRMKKCIES